MNNYPKDYLLENRNNIKQYFRDACKKNGEPLCFGLELEHFVVYKDSKEAVSYFGDYGVEFILKQMQDFFDESIYEEEYLIGLKNDELTISLEPGAQLEISIAKKEKIDEILKSYNHFLNIINPILKRLNYELVTSGYQPKSKVDNIDLLPKKRYVYMDRYFCSLNGMGRNMMRGTAATQLSIDFYSEEDFRKKFLIAYHFQNQLMEFMDNVSVFEGQPTNEKFLRKRIWQYTDPSRVDLHPYMSEDGLGFDAYIDFLMQVKLIVEKINGDFVYSEKTVSDLCSEKLLSIEEIEHVLSMVFPMVRAKKFLEIRFADSCEIQRVLEYVKLIQKLFSNPDDTIEKYIK